MDIATSPTLPADGDPAAKRPDICVILNRSSGRKEARATAMLQEEFERHPGRFVLRTVSAGKTISREVERAVADGFGTIAAAGGDGTMCAVASALVGTEVRMGVIPMGTFNYFARGLSIPEEPAGAAIDVVAGAAEREVTVGEVNGTPFLNNASIGLYPAILRQRETTYRRWGRSRLAAYWSVLVTFIRLYRPLLMKVTVDGKPLRKRTPLAFVARSAYQLELFKLDGAECVRDDRFALFLAPDVNRWHLLLFALRLASGSMEPGRDYELICGSDVTIETKRKKMLLARDGERSWQKSPLHFRIRRGALRVIAPEAG